MTTYRWAATALAAVVFLSPAVAQEKAKKKLLFVTHSGGFIHESVSTAEDVMKEVCPKHGYEVTCWRFTGDPDAKVKVRKDGQEVEVTALQKESDRYRQSTGRTGAKTIEKEHCGRINAESLKKFDVVLFFTTGSGPKKNNIGPMTPDELKDLTAWVKAGGAFAGTHCASDTMYDSTYGELIGGYFKAHPPGLHNVKLKIEDPKHPAAVGFENGQEYKDEIYVFTDTPYSREKLHIIMSCEKGSFKEAKGNAARADEDYAISWCREEGKGKVFYTSLGHQPSVWKDEKFQKHLFGGLDWATGQKKGDATPSNKLK
jgi:type 1 glutamine amidotransferase